MKRAVGFREAVLVVVVALSGCARDRIHVVPAPVDLGERNPGKRICIVENPQVAVGNFLEAYRAALRARGYTADVVKKNPPASACPLSTRYVAYSNGYAHLDLYWEGKPVGSATHSAAAYSEEAITLLVNRLLP